MYSPLLELYLSSYKSCVHLQKIVLVNVEFIDKNTKYT